MPSAMSRFEAGGVTHVGNVRRQNEDSYLVATSSGIWAVADGMGGHAAGDLASQTVVEELRRIAAPSSATELLARCEAGLVSANSRLRAIADERGGALIGSTVAVLLIYHEFYACLWSGDSRIYRIRTSSIEQLSADHTEVQELIAEGTLTPEEARAWPRRNIITRAIGVFDHPELEMVHGALEPHDIFVICSDGLTNHVEDCEILALATDNPPQRACDLMVTLTLDRGASDNVTVVVVRFDPAAPAPAAMAPKAAGRDVWE
jgi:protein phosphatase